MEVNFAILVNTTDSFEACWQPFFRLFKFYWPDYKGKIYLNTEKKNYSHKGLDIRPVKNGRDQVPDEWSNCLNDALDFIEEDYILYFQDDYFICDYVRCDLVDYFTGIVQEDDVTYINLYPFSRYGYKERVYNDHLWEADKTVKNSFNLQVSLWDKKVMKSMLKFLTDRTPWNSEAYVATRMVKNCPGRFLFLNPQRYSLKNMPIPYVIGIVRGKWSKRKLNKLFKKHGMML